MVFVLTCGKKMPTGYERDGRMDLDGKTALVTGASRGIGKAIAVGLAQRGADVIVNYVSRPEAALEVADQIRSLGRKALAARADVCQYGEVETMIGSATESLGPIDILVNNAGVHRGGRIEKISPEDWRLVISASLLGAFHCSRLVVPMMKEKQWGRIIHISSPTAIHGSVGDTAYSSAKAGLLGLTKAMALELAPFGICVNAVLPGFVVTEMTASLSESQFEKIRKSLPLQKFCEAEEVAEMVNFLVCEGSQTIGAVCHADGGMGLGIGI